VDPVEKITRWKNRAEQEVNDVSMQEVICMNGIKYQVRVHNILSEELQVITGLKQGDALSPLLFNIALEKVVWSIHIP